MIVQMQILEGLLFPCDRGDAFFMASPVFLSPNDAVLPTAKALSTADPRPENEGPQNIQHVAPTCTKCVAWSMGEL